MSRIVVTGATGTIGSALIAEARGRGEQIVALSRNAAAAREKLGEGVEAFAWPNPTAAPPPPEALRGADAVIHLLGEPIDQRWTASAKKAIRESRELGTRMLVRGLAALDAGERPGVLVSQSAVGIYGARGEEMIDETTPPGKGFQSDVVRVWEEEAQRAPDGVRVAVMRCGVVLSPTGGALAKMLPFFRAGVGGPIAGGRQFVPWIHLDDVVGGLLLAAGEAGASGPINLTAPTPVTNKELSRALGRVIHRPAVLPVPAFGVRLLYGEMAEIVISGARVVPVALERLGHRFRHSDVEAALAAALGRS